MKLHKLLFLVFTFLIPFQTRILYNPGSTYINGYFDYHLAFFLYLTDIVLFVCFMDWLVFDRPKSSQLLDSGLFRLCLLFLGLALVTLFHVKHVSLAWYEWLKWVEFLLIILYMKVTLINELDFRILAKIVVASGLFQAILALVQFHMQHMVGLKFLGEYVPPLGTPGLATIDTLGGKLIRAYGTMPHPNVLGAFLVLSVICSLYIVSHETKRIYVTTLTLTSIVIILGIFVSFSRIAWLASALAVISFIIYLGLKKQKIALIAILIAAIVSCGTILAFYRNDLKARVTDVSQTSITDRYYFDRLGLDLIQHYPVLGVGVGNYVDALQDLYRLEPWQHQPAHNIFIFVGAELGLLGLGLFVMILYEIFRQLKNNWKELLPFSFGLLGILFLLMGQFDHYFVTIQQGRLEFALVLGLIAALPNLANKFQEPNSKRYSNSKHL